MTDDGRKGQSLCPGWSTLATTSTSPWAQLILTSSSTQPQWHCWYLVRFPSLRFRGRMNGLRWEVALGGVAGQSAGGYERLFGCRMTWYMMTSGHKPIRGERKNKREQERHSEKRSSRLLQAHYDSLCIPASNKTVVAYARGVEKNWQTGFWVTEFTPDTWFGFLLTDILHILLLNTKHVACNLLPLFSIIQYNLQLFHRAWYWGFSGCSSKPHIQYINVNNTEMTVYPVSK